MDSQLTHIGQSGDGNGDHFGGGTIVPLEQVFSSDVEIIEFEETQDLSEPLTKPLQQIQEISTRDPPLARYKRKLQEAILAFPQLIRNVALVGHSSHGKTSIVNCFVSNSHIDDPESTDYFKIEKDRSCTLRTKVINTIYPTPIGKSISANLVDTPGHADFWDEMVIGMHLADIAVLVLDVCEPLLPTDIAALKQTTLLGKKLVLCINKIDRLLLELDLDSRTASMRIFYLLDQVNAELKAIGGPRIDQTQVVFSSAEYSWSFTLPTINSLYSRYGDGTTLTVEKLQHPNAFATYAIDPIFKLYKIGFSGDEAFICQSLASLGINLGPKQLKLEPKDLLQHVFRQYFDEAPMSSLIDQLQCGPGLSEKFEAKVVKMLYYNQKYYALTKITGGKLEKNSAVWFGDKSATVGGIFLPCGSYNLELETVFAGNICLLGGLDALVQKHGIITGTASAALPTISSYLSLPLIKIGVEPRLLSQIDTFLSGLSILSRTWGALQVKTEGTGEHLVYGTGELYLDCALQSLRTELAGIELQLTDPTVQFRETVLEKSYSKCPTATPDEQATFTAMASPLPDTNNLQTLVDTGVWPSKDLERVWQQSADNVLLGQCDIQQVPEEVAEEIVQGYDQTLFEGPLCNEPLCRVQFDLSFTEPQQQSGQILPTVKRACAAAFLVASPRLMEPIWKASFIGPVKSGSQVYRLLAARRGRVLKDEPVPGTTLHEIIGEIPVLDAFGFETQVMGHCHGLLRVSFSFDRWSIVPGDPLMDARIPKLQRVEDNLLARDIMVKTRKRKGLGYVPHLKAFVDEAVAEKLGL